MGMEQNGSMSRFKFPLEEGDFGTLSSRKFGKKVHVKLSTSNMGYKEGGLCCWKNGDIQIYA
jgi:hypothetical protein